MPEAEVVNTVANGNEATASPMLKINIVEQIEYYFGDFNLMKDKFLKQEIQKDDGWVPLATLLNFNRLAALTKDVDVIVSAFKENPSELVEIDNARKCVRRHPDRALPEHDETWRHSIAQRTVYVKGFPTETATLDEILKFMQTFGKIDNVSKRNYYDKTSKSWKFKGSIYAAFPNREEAEKFISIKSVKYAGNELIRKLQIDYIEQKKQERMEHKMKAQKMKDDLLKEQQEGKKKELKKLPTGALIHVSGLTSDINRNQLKDAAKALGWDVAFVDHNKEDNTAYIRLQGQDSAKEALSKLENNSFEVEKTILKAEVVEGEKETELLKKMEDDKNHLVMQNFMKSKKGKKFKTGKKFSRRGNYGSEKDSNDDDQPSTKDDASEAAQKNDVSEKKSEDSCPIKRKLNEELEETAKKSKANDE